MDITDITKGLGLLQGLFRGIKALWLCDPRISDKACSGHSTKHMLNPNSQNTSKRCECRFTWHPTNFYCYDTNIVVRLILAQFEATDLFHSASISMWQSPMFPTESAPDFSTPPVITVSWVPGARRELWQNPPVEDLASLRCADLHSSFYMDKFLFNLVCPGSMISPNQEFESWVLYLQLKYSPKTCPNDFYSSLETNTPMYS